MPFTRDQAYEALASLNPAQVFLDVYRNRNLPGDLDIYVGSPEELFIAPETQRRFGNGRLIPILDDGNFDIVTFLDPENRSLVEISVERPSEIRARFVQWSDYLSSLMARIGESVDDDRDIATLARLIGAN
jgi:hypothetical protein